MPISRRPSRAAVGDVGLAALFALAGQLDVWVRGTVAGPRWENAVVLSLVSWPLVARRSWPSGVLCVIAVGIAVQALVVPGPPPSGLLYAGPVVVGAYSVGAHSAWSWRALAALFSLAVAFDGVYAAAQGISGTFTQVVGDLVWLVIPTGAWLLGAYVRRRRLAAAASVAALRLERDQERERLAMLEQERVRMARELHDILAHSVSLMGVQAGAVEEVLGRDVELARPLLQSIQQTARESVGELRRLLGILRAEGVGASLAPQPSLHELEPLVARMREAGLPVQMRTEGAAHSLPPGVELTAYRIVQESLTNALKHARPTRVEVVLRYAPDHIDVAVRNDGVVTRANGAGHGLLGMRERVLLYGGTLEAVEAPDGEFSVDAAIPLEAAAG
jgi:signal transduction histidine kinase